jgi:hypothetical protein
MRFVRRRSLGHAAAILVAAVISSAAWAVESAEDALPEGPSAAQLLDRAFRNLYDADFVQVVRITSRSRTGREWSQRLQITRKQTAGPGRALVRFLGPPDLRGTSLLVIENEGRHDDVFVYLPAFERTRRISSAQRSDAFFGTDLTYEDLEPKRAADYEARFAGSGPVAGVPCLLVEARPRPGIESQYEKTVYGIDPTRNVVLRAEHHRQGSLWKRLETDPAEIHEVQGRQLPFRARLSNPGQGTETRLETESYELQPFIADSVFTETNLAWGDEERDRSRSAEGRAEESAP